MEIQNNIHFKGWDARPLKALILRETNISDTYQRTIKKLAAIGEKEGFDVFIQSAEEIVKASSEYEPKMTNDRRFVFSNLHWVQDVLTFTPDGKIFAKKLKKSDNSIPENLNRVVGNFFGIPVIEKENHIPGGNMFFIKEGDKKSLIIGNNDFNKTTVENLRRDFSVDNIYPISQPDYHIDLGIRPLKDKTVLVEDQEMMVNILEEGIQKVKNYLHCHPEDKEVEKANRKLENLIIDASVLQDPFLFNYAGCDKSVQEQLTKFGFNVVKVPGAIRSGNINLLFTKDNIIERNLNFLNAIVHERQDGSLVYITNSGDEAQFGLTPEVRQKIGFSFEEKFRQCISPFVAEEDIHFMDIDKFLRISEGGIHCLCAEVPRY